MYIKKNLRRMITISILAGSLTFAPEINCFVSIPIAHAEIQMYEGIGEYIMSDFEKHDIAKQRAKVRAEQAAKEKAGVYLKTYSKTVNAALTDDEVSTMTNNIVKILDVKYEPVPIEVSNTTGLMYRAKVKVNIDTDGVNNWLKRDLQEREVVTLQNIEIQKSNTQNDKRTEELKLQAAKIKTESEKEKIKSEFEKMDNEFLSNQKLEEGNNYYLNNEYEKAIDCYSEAIKLNPKNYIAYCNRGLLNFQIKGKKDDAMKDFNEGIKINSNYSLIYYNRALIHYVAQRYDNAIDDFGKAIELDPNFTAAV